MWSKKGCCSQCICPMSLGFASTLIYVIMIFAAAYFQNGDMPLVTAHKMGESVLWSIVAVFAGSFFLALFYNLFNRFFSWVCCRRCSTCNTSSCSSSDKK